MLTTLSANANWLCKNKKTCSNAALDGILSSAKSVRDCKDMLCGFFGFAGGDGAPSSEDEDAARVRGWAAEVNGHRP